MQSIGFFSFLQMAAAWTVQHDLGVCNRLSDSDIAPCAVARISHFLFKLRFLQGANLSCFSACLPSRQGVCNGCTLLRLGKCNEQHACVYIPEMGLKSCRSDSSQYLQPQHLPYLTYLTPCNRFCSLCTARINVTVINLAMQCSSNMFGWLQHEGSAWE